MGISDADRFKMMAKILDGEGRDWRPWLFFAPMDPQMTLPADGMKGVQYGMIKREEVPCDPNTMWFYRIVFKDGVTEVNNPRVAAALYFQPGLTFSSLKAKLDAAVEAQLAEAEKPKEEPRPEPRVVPRRPGRPR
jgi:hypothetical protein